jgi:hypothetical protein
LQIQNETQRDLMKWTQLDINELVQHDLRRVTEDGAEAVALAIAGKHLGFRVVRRMQREESADWLLEGPQARSLEALEVSGVDRGPTARRLNEKRRQVRLVEDVDRRWVAIVGFEQPQATLVQADEAPDG